MKVMGMGGEGKAREKRREKGSEKEENRKGRGRLGKEIKLVATLYTPTRI